MAELEHHLDAPGNPGGHREFIFQCDGFDAHYVRITRDAEDPDWNFFWIEELVRPRGLRSKIRETWRLWRGESHFGEIVINADVAAKMREALS